MTIDERIDKLEFLLTGHIEQAKKDYEENRRLWRDQQTDIAAIWQRMEARDREWNDRIAREREDWTSRFNAYATENRDREQRIDARIEKLVSAIMKLVEKNGTTK